MAKKRKPESQWNNPTDLPHQLWVRNTLRNVYDQLVTEVLKDYLTGVITFEDAGHQLDLINEGVDNIQERFKSLFDEVKP